MATITPTRFGLKYAPVPTLALEYEEDLGVVENDDGTRSLYVFKETTADRDGSSTRRVRKKLHVVELPQLHGRSEPLAVVRQLQKDNHRYLGPSVVKEQQLQRLLQRLVDHLPGRTSSLDARDSDVRVSERAKPVATTPAAQATREEARDFSGGDDAEDEDEHLEESVMEDSVVEASASMEASDTDDNAPGRTEHHSGAQNTGLSSLLRTGKFITQEDDDDGEGDEPNDAHDRADSAAPSPPRETTTKMTEEERAEAEEDTKKKQTLKSESDASEEDVQSEELEYFSEDGSDEDSF